MTVMMETRMAELRLCVDEELDIVSVPRVWDRLEETVALRPRLLTVDLSHCGFIDSQALAMLAGVRRSAEAAGVRLVLTGCSPWAARLMDLYGPGLPEREPVAAPR